LRTKVKYLTPYGPGGLTEFEYGAVDAETLEVLNEPRGLSSFLADKITLPWVQFYINKYQYNYDVHYKQLIKCNNIDIYLYY
jgi:hypothetical protein